MKAKKAKPDLIITNEFEDDHSPCVEFTWKGIKHEIWWTDGRLIGKLELVQDGTITLSKALAKYPQTLKAITTHEKPDDNEDSKLVWYSDAGCLTIYVGDKNK